jgi:hypothetical protein
MRLTQIMKAFANATIELVSRKVEAAILPMTRDAATT